MDFASWGIAIVTALIGAAGIWAAVFDIAAVFQLNKIAFLDRQFGHRTTRILVGIGGLLLIALAASFVIDPPK